jgi:hypothetical protein
LLAKNSTSACPLTFKLLLVRLPSQTLAFGGSPCKLGKHDEGEGYDGSPSTAASIDLTFLFTMSSSLLRTFQPSSYLLVVAEENNALVLDS